MIHFSVSSCRLNVNQIYLAYASEKTIIEGKDYYATETPIYVWLGKHFDLVNTVKAHRPFRLMAFTIGSLSFLIVGNSENKYGNTSKEMRITFNNDDN